VIDPLPYPEIVLMDQYQLNQDNRFSLYLLPNQDLTYYDNTAMFEIENGWINFTPSVVTLYNITIRAVGLNGQETLRNTQFDVR